jgi:hypothetical protein
LLSHLLVRLSEKFRSNSKPLMLYLFACDHINLK